MEARVFPVVLIMAFAVSGFAQAGTYGGGSGTPEDPYQIWTPEQMNTIGANPSDWASHFKLMADIDMSACSGAQYHAIGDITTPFTKVFDGNRHIIKNLTYAPTGIDHVGLFGYTVGAVIKDLGVENISISSGYSSVGGLVGRARSSSIWRCFVTGSVSGETRIGGLVGYSENCLINNSYTRVLVTATGTSAGGLIGETAGDNIGRCYSTGVVNCGTYGGGFVGYRTIAFISNCFWDTQTSGLISGIGYGPADGVTGKTTAQMNTQSTFTQASWAFEGDYAIWKMVTNSYPRLLWESLYGGGTGTADDPYQIWTACQMNTVGTVPQDWTKHFKLMADIDMSAYTGTQYYIIGNRNNTFRGTFDGGGHVIRNLTYTTPSQVDFVGLFGYIRDAIICNVGLSNVTISSGGIDVGGLVGCFNGGTISHCFVTGSVHGARNVGGLIGYKYGSLSNCYAIVSVSGNGTVGGLVGYSDSYSIVNCYSAGEVSGATVVGGFMGVRSRGTITSGFWDTQTSGRSNALGSGDSVGIYGKTTDQMKMLATFTSAGWDFLGETANGTEDIWFIREGSEYPRFVYEDSRPVAEVNDVIAYAWVDGFVEVRLDGSGSYDADGDALEYGWYSDANELIANNAEPNLVFNVGQYVLRLIVNDGIDDSEPNECTVTVIAAAQTVAKAQGANINPKTRNLRVKGRLEFAGEQMPQLDTEQAMLLVIGDSRFEAQQQALMYSAEDLKWYLTGEFGLDAAIVSSLNAGEITVLFVSRYAGGVWVYGSDSLKILNKQK